MNTKKVLVVVDMQNDFITGSLGTKEAESIVDNVCEKVSNWDGKIFYTKDTHLENYLKTLEGIKLPVEHCIMGTYGWLICDKLKNLLFEKHGTPVIKYTFGALSLTEMIDDPDEIEICGLCTDICVISNALILRAEFPNVPITVNKNLCAGTTVEKHNTALEILKSCQIDVI